MQLEIGSVILAPGFEEFAAEKKGNSVLAAMPTCSPVYSLRGCFPPPALSKAMLYGGRTAKKPNVLPGYSAWAHVIPVAAMIIAHLYAAWSRPSRRWSPRTIRPDLNASIFYMDIRAHGKDFDQYYERARSSENINYIKSMPSRIVQMPGTKDLR